jgi:uncharacterized protein YndB with AHSA1/START domain
MTVPKKTVTPSASKYPDLVITRVFDAPREQVWKAWTEPNQMAKWWGPHNFTNPVCEMDVRPQGAILIHMQGPEGPAFPMKGVFQEVVPPEKLVFTTQGLEDAKGGFGIETLSTVTFTEENGKTRLTLHVSIVKLAPEAAEALRGQKAGWNQSLDRLFGLLSESPEFVLTRVFDAPRERVWKAYSEVENLAAWWGPKELKMADIKLDFRPGGLFHYSMIAPEGFKMWGRFVYREIEAPERLSFVVSFSDEKGGVTRHPISPKWPAEVLSTLTFFEIQPGKTAIIMSGVPINATEEERKTFEAGRESMNQGFKGTLDQLADYLARPTH